MPLKRVPCSKCGGTGLYTERYHNQPTDVCYGCDGEGFWYRAEAPVHHEELPAEAEALAAWRAIHGQDAAHQLKLLKLAEYPRYERAVRSIMDGRGAAVADALQAWYAQFRRDQGLR